MNKTVVQIVLGGVITAAIVGVYSKLDTLAKGQSELNERVVRIETIVVPPKSNLAVSHRPEL